jgi:hypothetical protein
MTYSPILITRRPLSFSPFFPSLPALPFEGKKGGRRKGNRKRGILYYDIKHEMKVGSLFSLLFPFFPRNPSVYSLSLPFERDGMDA